MTSKLERERLVTNELRSALDQKATELEATTRKNMNRDRPLNGGSFQDIPPSPAPPTTTPLREDKTAKEEIKGLRYVNTVSREFIYLY